MIITTTKTTIAAAFTHPLNVSKTWSARLLSSCPDTNCGSVMQFMSKTETSRATHFAMFAYEVHNFSV
jgi:hypothetical protein